MQHPARDPRRQPRDPLPSHQGAGDGRAAPDRAPRQVHEPGPPARRAACLSRPPFQDLTPTTGVDAGQFDTYLIVELRSYRRESHMGELTGKVAIVTGASKGIGAGIAKAFGAAGAAVAVNYASSRQGAERVVAEIAGNGGKAIAVQADMSKASDVRRLFEETKKAFDGLDVLVNNAAVYAFHSLEEVTEAEFHRHYDINVLGPILAAQEAVKYFGAKGGSIINIGSTATSVTPPRTVVYTGTKGALDMTTRVLAKELGPRKIRVNSINPGGVETEGTHAAGVVGSDF